MKNTKEGIVMETGDRVRMLTGITGLKFHLRTKAEFALPHHQLTNEDVARLIETGAAELVKEGGR